MLFLKGIDEMNGEMMGFVDDLGGFPRPEQRGGEDHVQMDVSELFAGGPRLGDPFFVKRGVDAPLDQIGKVVGGFPVADIIDRHKQKR